MFRIILLEPNDRTRRIVVRVLVEAGFTCVSTAELGAAAGFLKNDRADVMMVGIDALCRASDVCLVDVRRAIPSIKLLMYSAGAPPALERRGCSRSCPLADGFLSMPFETEELIAEVNRVLKSPPLCPDAQDCIRACLRMFPLPQANTIATPDGGLPRKDMP